jgi:hypothetical protein
MGDKGLTDKDLLPCPRCGGGAEVFPDESDAGYYVMCAQPAYPFEKCWLSLGEEYDRDAMPQHAFRTKEEAITAWNTRASDIEILIYWLLRAYQSGNREGWEPGPSVDETMGAILSVLANRGYDPHRDERAKELLKQPPRF